MDIGHRAWTTHGIWVMDMGVGINVDMGYSGGAQARVTRHGHEWQCKYGHEYGTEGTGMGQHGQDMEHTGHGVQDNVWHTHTWTGHGDGYGHWVTSMNKI